MAGRKRSPYISAWPGSNGGGVNDQCHGWAGIVPGHQHHVMASPKVYAVYWDAYFQKTPAAVARMNQFFTEILRGDFMRQLQQYGVRHATFAWSSVIVPDPHNPPPSSLTHSFIENHLKSWIDNGTVTMKPAPDETNLLYVVFTPNHTSIGRGFCGYHKNGHYAKSSGDANLFWAAIQAWHHPPKSPPAPKKFVDSCTWCVSHELVEAFTDRDGEGFITPQGCEIGDICECAKGCPKIIKVNIDGWMVETYWDNQNQSCYPLHAVPRARGKPPHRRISSGKRVQRSPSRASVHRKK